MAYPQINSPIPIGDLENQNTDRTVDPVVMTRGIMYKTGGAWYLWDGQVRSDDAGLLRVSSIGGSFTSAPLSADSSSVSAIQENASNLRISAFSGDASSFRVSALGVTVTTSPLSADGSSVSAKQEDAANLRLSAFLADNPTITGFIGRTSTVGTVTVSSHEVKQSDAASLMVSARLTDDTTITKFFGRMSAISEGANLCRVSVIGTSAIGEGTAFIGQVSATLKAGTASIGLVSATLKEGTAMVGSVSAILRDNATITNYIGRVSSIQENASSQRTSSFSNDASLLRTSSFQSDASNQRVSADLYADTTGSLTVFRTLSVSASQSIKATAGSIYGYYLYNTDTKPNYVKFYNVSAAANIGTDTPVLTICLPASAAANVEFVHGLKGFTSGINICATSGRPDDNTALPAASAVGGNIFYS